MNVLKMDTATIEINFNEIKPLYKPLREMRIKNPKVQTHRFDTFDLILLGVWNGRRIKPEKIKPKIE